MQVHPGNGGGGVSWAFSQVACSTNTGCPNPNTLNCGSSATTCTATFSSALSAGDTLIIPEFGPASTTPDSITVTGGGTVVGPVSGCTTVDSGATFQTNFYYVASVSGGQTAVVAHYATPPTFYGFTVIVGHKTGGTPAFDVCNNQTVVSPTCSSCAGVNLSLTGSNDFIVRVAGNDNGDLTGVSGGYTLEVPNNNDFGFTEAYLVNATTGTGPTWTFNASGGYDDGGLAFK